MSLRAATDVPCASSSVSIAGFVRDLAVVCGARGSVARAADATGRLYKPVVIGCCGDMFVPRQSRAWGAERAIASSRDRRDRLIARTSARTSCARFAATVHGNGTLLRDRRSSGPIFVALRTSAPSGATPVLTSKPSRREEPQRTRTVIRGEGVHSAICRRDRARNGRERDETIAVPIGRCHECMGTRLVDGGEPAAQVLCDWSSVRTAFVDGRDDRSTPRHVRLS